MVANAMSSGTLNHKLDTTSDWGIIKGITWIDAQKV